MKATVIKKQYLATTAVSAGQALEKLEAISSPEARAMHKLVSECERAVVEITVKFDGQSKVARAATDQAKIADEILRSYVATCELIGKAAGISSVAAYVALDAEDAYAFSEHLEEVFRVRGAFERTLAQHLKTLRGKAALTRREREVAFTELGQAERALASSVMRLRGSIESARALLHINGVAFDVNRAGRKKKAAGHQKPTQPAPAPVLTVVPTPPAGPGSSAPPAIPEASTSAERTAPLVAPEATAIVA